jgi:hypothetical protein
MAAVITRLEARYTLIPKLITLLNTAFPGGSATFKVWADLEVTDAHKDNARSRLLGTTLRFPHQDYLHR